MNQEHTQLQRILRFGTEVAPRLTKDNLNHEAVNKFITHIRNLIRANAFDDSVMQQLMDSAAIRLLGILFTPSETARLHPIENHWTTDWDVATILKALEELYPMRPEDRHLAHSSKWHQIVIDARKKARIRPNDMDQSRRDTIHEWSTAEDSIGPIPDLNNDEILKDLSRCFTSKDNPAGTSTSNVQFQRDLSTIIRADNEYHSNPTLGRLCEMIAGIMHTWERLTAETNRMGGHVPSAPSSTSIKSKNPKLREDTTTPAVSTGGTTGGNCEGCNRPNHSRASCRLRFHPDFNKDGPWSGSAVETAIRVWDKQAEVRLPWTQRADGSAWEGTAEPATPKKKDKDKSKDKNYCGNSRGNNDGDRRGNDDGGGRGGSGRYALSHRHCHPLDMQLRWI